MKSSVLTGKPGFSKSTEMFFRKTCLATGAYKASKESLFAAEKPAPCFYHGGYIAFHKNDWEAISLALRVSGPYATDLEKAADAGVLEKRKLSSASSHNGFWSHFELVIYAVPSKR